MKFSSILTVLVAVIIFSVMEIADISAANAPRAVISSSTHDFGTVNSGETVVHAFTLQNQGTAPLSYVRDPELFMPGMTVRFGREILPGEAGTVTVEWDTSKVRDEVEGKVILHLNDPAQPQVTLLLRGVVTSPIDYVPMPAVFFSVFHKETAERGVMIINNEEHPLTITQLEPDGEHFVASIRTVEIGKVFELRVTVPPNVSPGRYREAVYLHTDNPTRPRLKIAVNVLVKSDVFVSPPDVIFGQVNMAQLRKQSSMFPLLTQTFLVKRRDSEMTITSVTTDVPFLDIQQDPPERGQIFRFDVGLDMDRIVTGKFDGSIIIKTDDPEFPELVVPVRGEIKE